MGKYLFEGNVRRDGSSKFLNDKWGVFRHFQLVGFYLKKIS